MNGNILFRQTLQHLAQKRRSEAQSKPASRLPWDDEILGTYKEKWLAYFKMLDTTKDITFPRATTPLDIDRNIRPDLITLSDGNEDAFGAVAYSRWTLNNGSKEDRLIAAKAKLGPFMDKGEVVKMELSSAAMAARLKSWILKNTRCDYGTYYPFLDSRIVQHMIRKESYSLNTFAGLRVKEITAKSDVSAWLHISSKDNYVADILTRGSTPEKLGEKSEWQRGPTWLYDDIEL